MNAHIKGMRQKIPQASFSYIKQKEPEPYIIIKVEDDTIMDIPVENCTEHSDLLLLEDEKLVKPGDKFSSHKDFVQYLNDNAKRWYFYYSCSDSRKPNTEYETYTYSCVYLKNREKYMKKGLRKRTNNLKTDCPCKIRLRHLPNEKELTVVFVCNHHDHELSEEQFNKLQHGRRLPPYVKEEIMDLLFLQVSVERIRQYVQIETGFNMGRPFFYGIERTMRMRNTERQISEARLKQLSTKISVVDAIYNKPEATEDQVTLDGSTENIDDPSDITIKSLGTRNKRESPAKRRSQSIHIIDDKRIKLEDSGNVTTEDETIQCVMNLEESVKCETVRNPWVMEQAVPTLPNRMLISSDCDGSVQVNIIEGNVDNKTMTTGYGNVEYLYDYCDQNTADKSAQEETVSEVNDSITTEINDTCIAYETVVTETDDDFDKNQAVGNDDSSVIAYDYAQSDNEGNDFEDECENEEECDTQEMEEIIEYVNSDGEIIDYSPDDYNENSESAYTEHVEDINDNDAGVASGDNEWRSSEQEKEDHSGTDKTVACDAAVQTSSESAATAQYFLPVFDVYMKDGNVTGFVVNNDVVQNSKNDGTEKSVQTECVASEETPLADDVVEDNVDEEPSIFIEHTSKDTFTKHEYIHKYNLEQYMVLPHIPKYIETLAKQTNMDVLKMFTTIYNEKAMFKLTTTQRGKEGNTTIWYISNTRIRRKGRGGDAKKREQLGKNLRDVLLLKDKVKMLKKQNSDLVERNKYLEDIALRVAKLG